MIFTRKMGDYIKVYPPFLFLIYLYFLMEKLFDLRLMNPPKNVQSAKNVLAYYMTTNSVSGFNFFSKKTGIKTIITE